MPQFGTKSQIVLRELDDALQLVLNDAIQSVPKEADFSLIEGHRDKATQNKYYEEGTSTLKWPDSRHNKRPSQAIDLIPYPSGYGDLNKFFEVATYIFASAQKYGIELEWGGHWHSFKDYPHWQIKT